MRVVVIVAVTAAIAGLAVAAFLVFDPGERNAAVVAPITPTATGGADARISIPEGFLEHEDDAKRPLDQPEIRWERTDEPSLPPLLSPCGTPPDNEADRVAGRQIALVHPNLYKIERMVIYRDQAGAERTMSAYREALRRCANHPEPDGTTTRWVSESLDIGQEALFVAGQRYRGDRGTHGHHRCVLMRQGRTIVIYLDFGQATTIADRSETLNHERDARTMAAKIAAASWS